MTKNRLRAIEVRKNKHLNEKQKQLTLGTLLGDGSMFLESNGARGIQFAHCEKQFGYLEWKKSILIPFIVADKASKYLNNDGSFMRLYRSIIHQDFIDIYGLLYRKIKGKEKKFLTRRYLNKIDVFGLLIWFLDDGCVSKDKDIRLGTDYFSLSEQKAIKIWFWQKFRIQCTISFNRTKKTYFLLFNTLNGKRLMRLFVEYIKEIPECMLYKFRFHIDFNDFTLNYYASTDLDGRSRRYSLNTMETL